MSQAYEELGGGIHASTRTEQRPRRVQYMPDAMCPKHAGYPLRVPTTPEANATCDRCERELHTEDGNA